MSEQGSRLIPNLVYQDAAQAIDWLAEAFGFECTLRVDANRGGIAHAQLVHGDSMIMLSSVRDDDFGKNFAAPPTIGANTQGIYLVVDDVQGYYDRANAAGAETILPVTEQDYGGSGFTVHDIGGHIWSFGSYNPWLGL